MSVVLYGDTSLFDLKTIAERFRDDLLLSEHISQVAIEGLPRLEFSVEFNEEVMRRYGLTFDQVAQQIREWNENISGGKIETEREELLIRSYHRSYQAEGLRDIPLRAGANGQTILLGSLATIQETWEDSPNRSYYNGKNSVVLNIDKTINEDILKSANTINEAIEEFNGKNAQIQAIKVDDRTINLRERIELLAKNGVLGLILVLFILGLFLNLRLAAWVALGIPFSFAGLFVISYLADTTINVISTFGMIIVIGILVDDAIVVGENIYAHFEKGVGALKAAMLGTQEMLAPVFTSVATTIIAFTPFFFLDGFLGKFIWNMAFVVIVALVFSLVEAFLILPPHLAHSGCLKPETKRPRLRVWIEKIITWVIDTTYAPTLKLALAHKWITLSIPVFFLLFTIGLLRGGLIGMTFFPFIDGDTLPVNLALEPGTQEQDTLRILKFI
jgi:multidrug efflux pump subunit AcrB